MAPIPVPVIAAGVSGLADIAGGLLGASGARSQNRALAASTANNIAAQERSQKHRFQWAVEDAKKAGLNPIYAAGSPASGISGGQYSPVNTQAPIAAALGGLGQNFAGTAKDLSGAKNLQEQARKTAFEIDKKLPAELKLIKSQVTKNEAETRFTQFRTLLTRAEIPLKEQEAILNKMDIQFFQQYSFSPAWWKAISSGGWAAKIALEAIRGLHHGADAVGKIKPFVPGPNTGSHYPPIN